MRKETKTRIISIITTVLYIGFMLLLLLALILNFNKKNNEVSSFLGYSFAVVQSGSMVDGGFNIGDMVIIKQVDPDTIREGDIIVFYNCQDAADIGLSLTPINENIETVTPIEKDDSELNRKTKQDAINAGCILVFHRVVNSVEDPCSNDAVCVDAYGKRFFTTKGDSNSSVDFVKVREDFVCAKYVQTSGFVQGVMQFVTSPAGLVIVIIMPVILTVFLQCFSFGKEVKASNITGQLISRKMKYSDVDGTKIKINEFLSEPEKVYLYDISPKTDKMNLAIVLWDEGVDEALILYDTDREKYYNYFEEKFSKSQNKELAKLKVKADLINENPDISNEELDRKAKVIYLEQKEKQKNVGNNDSSPNGN